MKLSQLLSTLPQATLLNDPNCVNLAATITHLTADSRDVEPGALFVAYRGVFTDIHRFIPDALAHGAAAVIGDNVETLRALLPASGAIPIILVPNGREALAHLAAAWHHFPARRLTMVGITGTDGKTTTAHFLFQMLQAARQNAGIINTVSAIIGQQTLETGLHTTTPDALHLQQYLAQMVKASTDVCVLEVTSHGLAHHRVTACDFDVAVVTNITHEHLDEHGSLENYRAAKAMLFESLSTAADKGHPKLAVLNCDDESFPYLKQKLAAANTPWLGYSLTNHPEAALIAAPISYQADKTRFTIQTDRHTFEVETRLVGDYNVSNCLAAATAALYGLNLSPTVVQQGAALLAGVPGRMERIDEGQPFLALVDFAHTPNSLRRSLAVAQTLTSGRVIAVFGCAGLRDAEKRPLMGRIAAELADITILTAEDPRTEKLDEIMAVTADAMSNEKTKQAVFECIPDRGRAIYRAVQLARPTDVVIAFGKGHEQSMCFGHTEYPWDDRQAMRHALQGAPLLTLPTAATDGT